MKQVPFKNYIILLIILVISTIVTFLLNNYLVSLKNNNKESILPKMLNEIKMTDIDNYIIENPNFTIYMSSKNFCNNIKFEESLKKFLIAEDLLNEFVFVNLDEVGALEYTKFTSKYYSGQNMPVLKSSIIVVQNKKVKDILNGSMKIKEVKKFLKDNGVY